MADAAGATDQIDALSRLFGRQLILRGVDCTEVQEKVKSELDSHAAR
jgi:imidazole glycerol phosphate synthase subunit HisF